MKLHKLVGSLIVGKVAGEQLTDTEEKLLREGTIGGVTLFKENAASVSQLVQLVDSVCKARPGCVIAVDQEGGAVQRFDHVLSPLPSQMALAASSDSQAIEKIVEINCRQLKLVGVNCLLAPVLDISCNPKNPIIGSRSFGVEANKVAELGYRYVEAVLANGLVPVGKHFPGHGDVSMDSHLDIPVLRADKGLLLRRELVPFQKSLPKLPVIMVGHICVPALTVDDVPASLSHNVTIELLRNQMGFDGLIVSDDLMMGAITKHYSVGEAAVKAIVAGADQVLVGGDCADVLSVHAALMNAVEEGHLSEARIAQAVERVHGVFGVNGGQGTADVRTRIKELERCIPSDSQTCMEIMQSAISVLRGKEPDIRQGRWNILVPDHPRYRLDLCQQLVKLVDSDISELRFPLDPSDKDIDNVLEQVSKRGTDVTMLSFRAGLYAGQSKLAKTLSQELLVKEHQLYCVETDIPNFLHIPELKNVIVTFDPSGAAMAVLARTLLPVNKKA